MADDYSKKALLDFLDFVGKKGLANGATVAARKASVNTLLSVLSDDEARDLRTMDLDDVALRFSHLKGSQFKPDSVRVYRSRVQNSLQDFKKYRQDPIGFRSGITPRRPNPSRGEKNHTGEQPISKQGPSPTTMGPIDEVTFPIPIRPDVVVRLIGIPSDLSSAEAKKIAKVVMALAQDDNEET